ncbi:hypothetical protein WN66_01855 [Saccharomyces cerevisiae]|uniref:Uncharacterized protein YER090C-A n=2 Tax=Saccharomyces cerevisiae TaxID=4932 RepID=YE090_YEAST|nr:RecName: Full=Uncharacterized protein YER090C-A [Saccharomyces cerevisiae S288C]KZV11857.1 hypothetical protein WN66_01855 [Saccharomyces cerevisiae]WNV72524.1 hypothetical protein O6U65_0839 [Saccharomyces cerevisiae synthetic construct]CAY79273.1 EC1118_1E8_2190p [Saccharomyces cerevisiae EC1118]
MPLEVLGHLSKAFLFLARNNEHSHKKYNQ